MPTTLRTVALALVLVGFSAADPEQRASQWPPDVQQVPDTAPVLSPAEAMKTFYMPPGYRLELVASEPMVQDPIWLDIDADGRFWVIEMLGFMPTADERNTTRDQVCRVVVLEDADDDGTMDRRTVFLDKLILPRSLKVLDRGVLVAEPPNLWLVRDTNGDLQADEKEIIREDFGRLQGNPEHNANGLLWGLDNWIYTSEHDGQFQFRNGKLEHHKTISRGQWGVTMDDVGRIYRNWNEQPAFVDLVPGRYYARNQNLVRTRGAYEIMMEPADMTVWPVRPTRGVNRGYREGTLRPDGTLTTYVSAGTPTVYRGDRLPKELYGNLFVTEPAGNLVHRLLIVEDSGNLRAKNGYERGEFLASTDERFRPVNLYSAPDGTLYIVDMYRGIIQEGAYQTDYLRNYIKARKLDVPIGRGRIYRVMHETTRRDRKPALSKQTPAQLVQLLTHPNGWWRDTAQRLLVERGDRSVAPALKTLTDTSSDERTRLHALWTLDGLDAIEISTVERALVDRSPHVRAAAVRMSERWMTSPESPILPAVFKLIVDESWIVRRQLAASLGSLPNTPVGDGRLPTTHRARAVFSVLQRYGNDPVTVDAAISGLQGVEADLLEHLLETSPQGVAQPDEAVTMLAAAIVRSGEQSAVEKMLQWVSRSGRAEWQQLALLRGAEAGLPGGFVPGAGRGAGGGGGRGAGAGRGLAAGRGAGGRGGGAPVLKLSGEPTAITALATTGRGELGQAAARLVARLDWPGKPAPPDASGGSKPAADAAPLTPDEQKRFVDGEEVYKNLCAACHQPDGRGLPNVAPALVASRWVTGSAGLAARIVLNGKEGERLMPPLASLTDDQIAAALTFVRRSWGHTASAVDPALVKQLRSATADRTRPWTEEELLRIPESGGGH